MSSSLPDLAEAEPVTVLEVAEASLVVAMPTAMLLVDYALAGLATPTPEPQAVASQLKPSLVHASHPIRAALAHGTALRSMLVAQVPDGHAAHRDWPSLRQWLGDMDDQRVLELVRAGVDSGLAYSGLSPTRAAPGAGRRRSALRQDATTVLETWRVPDATERAAELIDPGVVRSTLLALLDGVWELWLDQAWSERQQTLTVTDPVRPDRAGLSGSQWVRLVTGLRPDRQYADAADSAGRLTVMPAPGLGRSLSLFEVGDRTWVLHTPSSQGRGATRCKEHAGVALTDLGRLIPVMRALGDPTRLAVVLHLLERGPSTMPELTEALHVHQTTISRQVAALRRAGLADQDELRRVVLHREEIREACLTLLAELE